MGKIVNLFQRKMQPNSRKIEKNSSKRTEYCVICGAKTKYTFDVSVTEREHFVSGIGQLCPLCFEEAHMEAQGRENVKFVEDR